LRIAIESRRRHSSAIHPDASLGDRAQARWFELLGASIERELAIDSFSVLVMTTCPL